MTIYTLVHVGESYHRRLRKNYTFNSIYFIWPQIAYLFYVVCPLFLRNRTSMILRIDGIVISQNGYNLDFEVSAIDGTSDWFWK